MTVIHNIKRIRKFLSGQFQTIFLDYKIDSKPRLDPENNAYSKMLYNIIAEHDADYEQLLLKIAEHAKPVLQLKDAKDQPDQNEPAWNNGFLPGLDIINLYGMISIHKPKTYIEIGSGNSTKVVKKCIVDNKLDTKIISIDPFPRANIKSVADEIIELPLEKVADVGSIVNRLEAGDILFIDNSHWCFPNSDGTICFLEILPHLKAGVIVHFHDIYLPYDYPQFMCDRFYNEQYMLAAFIIANPQKYKTLLPNFYIYKQPRLHEILSNYWTAPSLANVEQHGGSFWIVIQ